MNQRRSKMEELKVRQGEKQFKILLNVMYKYLRILDIDTGTVHAKVFYELYFESGKTYEQIADDNFISVFTLRRYIKKYDELAEKLLQKAELFLMEE